MGRKSGGVGRRGLVGPALLLVATAAVLAAATVSVIQRGPGQETYAGLFAVQPAPIDLKLNGRDGVAGIIGGDVVPGDVVRGALQLTTEGWLSLPPLDLDIDVDYRTFAVPVNHPLDDPAAVDMGTVLIIHRLVYGTDDLLAAPGRNLIVEVDQNPIVGNDDGRLSLKELRAGANDLAPPGSRKAPTTFAIDVQFAPDAGPEFMGHGADVEITFYLAAVQEADLN